MRRKIRKILNDYPILKLEIEDIDIRVSELKSCNIMKSSGFDENFASGVSSTVENYILDKIGEEKLQKLLKDKYLKECKIKRLENAVKMLDQDEMELVKLRYFTMYNSWRDVANAMKFEIATCKKKDDRILDKLSRILL